MTIGHLHPGTIAGIWAADVLLLFVLWPSSAQPGDLGPVLLMWVVPTVPVGILTWRWWRTRAGPGR